MTSHFITHNHKKVPIHSFHVGGRTGEIILPKEQNQLPKSKLDMIAKQMADRHKFEGKHGHTDSGRLASDIGFRKSQDAYDHLTRPDKDYTHKKYMEKMGYHFPKKSKLYHHHKGMKNIETLEDSQKNRHRYSNPLRL